MSEKVINLTRLQYQLLNILNLLLRQIRPEVMRKNLRNVEFQVSSENNLLIVLIYELGINPNLLQHIIRLIGPLHQLYQGIHSILLLRQIIQLPALVHPLLEAALHLRHHVRVVLALLIAQAAAGHVVHEPPEGPHAVLLVRLAIAPAAPVAASSWTEAAVNV